MITMTTKRAVNGRNVCDTFHPSTRWSALRQRRCSCGVLRREIDVVVAASYAAIWVVLWLFLASSAYAQEQKVITTTGQQYQNMTRNASFESWSGGETAVPDAWTGVNGPSYTKLTNDKMIGASSLKITASASGQGVSQAIAVDPKNTYTVSFYYKVDTGGSATFNISGAGALVNQAGLNSTSWKRMAYSFDTGTADTSVTVKMTANGAYVFYIDGVTLTKGSQAPGFMDYALTDTGNQTIYGNLTTTGAISGNTISEGGTTLASKYVPLAGGANVTGGLNIATASGSLGVGTTAPDAVLSVKTSGQNAVVNLYGVSSGTDYGAIQVSNTGGLTNPNNRPLILQPNAGAVGTGGNVGIGYGETSPDSALSVKTAGQNAVVNIYGVVADTDYGAIQVSNIGGLTNPSIRPLVLQPNAGNVGIGTTAPGSKLSIAGGLSVGSTYQSVAAPSNGAIIEGLVGIGTASPSQKLDVAGNITTSGNITLSTSATTVDGVDLDTVLTGATEGEGIDITGTGHTRAIAGEDASTTNKGIASFNANEFTVSTGAVSVKTDGIDDTHLDFGTGANQIATADIPEQTNLYYTDTRVDARIDTNQTVAGNWEFSNAVTIPTTPTAAAHATSKQYVDNAIAGLKWKNSVRAATTGAGTLTTSFAAGQLIDGVTLTAGDRILVKDQAAGSENGIYIVASSGSPTRALDADIASELIAGAVFVEDGTTNADTAWVCSNNAITLETTALAFSQFAGGNLYAWGNGLSATGNTINVGAGTGITVAADTIAHADIAAGASVNNSNGTVIQDITLDASGLGHVDGIVSANLDDRYYTETEADTKYLRKDASTTQSDGLYIASDEIRARDAGGLKLYSSGGTTGVFVKDDGYVGIGTASPVSKLNIVGTTDITWVDGTSFGLVTVGSKGTGGSTLFVNTPAVTDYSSSGLGIKGTYVSNISTININAYGVNFGGYGSVLAFSTTNGTTLSEKMRINNSGNVGIGTTTPSSRLEIAGGNLDLNTNSLIVDSSGDKTLTAAELSYLDGVTSSIQTQIDSKAPTSHAANASTYGYGDATNAGHLRVGSNINISNGTISIPQSVATSASPTFAGATINGTITVSGTVDGRDVSSDGAKLDAVQASAINQTTGDGLYINVTGDTLTGALTMDNAGTADAATTTYDSQKLVMAGSYWDGAAAQTSGFTLFNDTTGNNAYKLSILDKTGTNEIAYLDQAGNLYLDGLISASQITGTLSGNINANQVNAGSFQNSAYTFPNNVTVTGTSALGNIQVSGNTISAANDSGVAIYDNASSGIFVKDGGNVGIGTTVPSEKLDVTGNIIASGVVRGAIVKATCDTAAATAGKTATIDGYTLTTGDLFAVTFSNGNSVSTPTIDINSTGAKNIQLGMTNASTTTMTLVSGATILLYYDGAKFQMMGSQRTSDSNNYDRTYWGSNGTAGATIYDYKLLMQKTNGKWYPLTLETGTDTTKTVSTEEFLINSPILYYATTTDVAANATFTNVYSEYPMTTLNYTANQASWTNQLPIYLKGMINAAGNFVLDNTSYTSFMTQALPAAEDGFVYILLGQMYTTTSMRFFQYHPMYEFKSGRIREYNSTYDVFVAKSGDTMTGALNFSGVASDVTSATNEHIALMPGGSGNVGIGTTDPAGYKLNVNGTGYFADNVTLADTKTVDGRDISADIDQAVKTTSSPSFAGLTLSSGNVTLSGAGATVDGVNLDSALTDVTVTSSTGLSVSGTGHTRTLAGVDATTAAKGIASFNANEFTVSTGAVSVKTDGIDDTHLDFGTGANQIATADIPEQTNLYYTDSRVDTRIDTNQTVAGNWEFSNAVTLPTTPTAAAHATSKQYVDNAIAGLKWKNSVRAATTGAGTFTTSFAAGQLIDGVTLTAGDRILIKDQGTGSENGIYIVASSGSPTRALDADIASELIAGAVFVEDGTTNADTAWVCSNNTITLETTALAFSQFAGGNLYAWGNGLSATGNTINVGAGTGITVAADTVSIDDSVLATQTELDTHISDTSTHGVTGAIVGTTDTQTLTNKTINVVSNGLTVGTNELVVSGGKVGIGTTSPTQKLDVVGSVNISEFIYLPVNRSILADSNRIDLGFLSAGLTAKRDTPDANTAFIVNQANASSTGDILQLKSSLGTALVVQRGGNVGIGTTNPATQLHLSDGNSLSGSLVLNAKYLISSNDLQAFTGVVASNTDSDRHVNSYVRARGTVTTPLAVQSGDYMGDLLFGGYDGSAIQYGAGVFAYVDGAVSSNNVPARISFVTGNSLATREERLTIKSDGNVGIGTTSPGTALDVAGAIRASNGFTVTAGTVTLPADSITDAMVSNTLTASDLVAASGVVNSTEIVDGAIMNADINASAAIDAVKIADGSVTSAEFQYLGTVTSNVQTQINSKAPTSHAANASTYGYGDATNAGHLRVGSNINISNGTISIPQSVATSASPTFAGATINGTITVSGTVDGRDVSADGAKLDAVQASAINQTTGDGLYINVTGDALTGALTMDNAGTADAATTTYDSQKLVMEGSYWDGAAAQASGFTVLNDTTGNNAYKLSILDKTGTNEIAYLDQAGNLYLDGLISASQITGTLSGNINANQVNSGSFQNSAYTFPNNVTVTGTSSLGNIQVANNVISATNDSGVAIYDNASSGIFVKDGGNVGIGTTAPVSRLDLGGFTGYSGTITSQLKVGSFELQSPAINNAMLMDNTYYKNNNFYARANGGAAVLTWYSGGFEIRPNPNTYNAEDVIADAAFNRAFRVNPDGSVALGGNLTQTGTFPLNTFTGAKVVINTSGNVGIGTTSPSEKLHIYDASDSSIVLGRAGTPASLAEWSYNAGIVSFGSRSTDALQLMYNNTQNLLINGNGVAVANNINFNVDSGTLFVDATAGNVGIGTSSPQAKLEVAGELAVDSSNYGTGGYGILRGDNTNWGPGGAIRFQSDSSLDANRMVQIGTITSGTFTPVITSLLSGNVGIGNTSPGTALDVTGTIRSSNGLTVTAGTVTLPADSVTDAMVSNTLTASNLVSASGVVDSTEIVDGAIMNADINASAAIVDTKLATISTAGKVSDSALSSAVTKLGSTIESGEITDGTIANADINASAGIVTSKLADSTALSDAMTKRHTQGTDTTLGTMTANIAMGSHNITGLSEPASDQDATTKYYVDNAIAGLSWKEAVIDKDLGTPPVSPTEGNRYLIPSAGTTGAWVGKESNYARYHNSAWVYEGPEPGDAVFTEDEKVAYTYNGTVWVAFTGASAYTWGVGLTNAGTTINIDTSEAVDLATAQTLTNKTLSTGTVLPSDYYAATYVNEGQASSVTSSMISNGTIVDADINASAAIVDTKLATISTAGKVSDSALSSAVTKLGSTIESGEITDLTIVNADINASAAIAGTKISPDFGAQNIITTGTFTMEKLGTATSGTTTYDSNKVALKGSYWDGAAAQASGFTVLNDTTGNNAYKLSILDKTGTNEIAYLDQAGNLYLDGLISASQITGTLSGNINANQVNSGSFQNSAYTFPNNVTVTGTSLLGNIQLINNTISATNDSGVAIYDNASGGIFVKDGGNVGIGTTNPGYKLHVNGTAFFSSTVSVDPGPLSVGGGVGSIRAASITALGAPTKLSLGAGGVDALVTLDTTGKLGIGTTSPGSALTVAGGDISIDNTRKVNLEGSAGDTFMYRTADNRVVLTVDGTDVAEWVKK